MTLIQKALNLWLSGALITLAVASFSSAVVALWLDKAWMVSWQVFNTGAICLEVPILIDSYATIFLFSVCTIASAVFLFSKSYMAHEKFFMRFHLILILFVGSMLLLILSPNLISLLLGWDGLGVTSYLLVIYFQSNKSYNAGYLTAMSNRVGDVLILLSIALLLPEGAWNFTVSSLGGTMDAPPLMLGLIIVAACTKSAQIPFSAWLPAAMAAPTPVSALVHSSTLVTAGVYLLLRFSSVLMWTKILNYVLVVGSLTMIMAGMAALGETDMKKIIALSTLSQLGLMMSAIGVSLPHIAYFHMLTHAYFKALLFMAVGNMIHLSADYQDLRKIGLLPQVSPTTLSFSLLANFSLCGLPFMAGFYSKDLWLELSWMGELNSGALWLFYIATGATAMYTLRFIILTTYSNMKSTFFWSLDNDFYMNTSMLLLGPLAIMGGSILNWTIFFTVRAPCLPLELKNLTLLIISAGAMLGILLLLISPLKQALVKWGLVAMWALPFFSAVPSQIFSMKSSQFTRAQIDLKWLPNSLLFMQTDSHLLSKLETKQWMNTYFIYSLTGFAILLSTWAYMHMFNFSNS